LYFVVRPLTLVVVHVVEYIALLGWLALLATLWYVVGGGHAKAVVFVVIPHGLI
jgi:hypothetical protein